MRTLIKHLSGSEEGRRDYFKAERIVLGRDDDCDVSFDKQRDLEVSGRHSEIVANGEGGFEIVDLGSTNGTWVNGEEITRSPLKSGDEIELGPGGPRLLFELPRGFWARIVARLFGR
ncbi:MAG: FHA domain-containing protein [Planctomycetota bacterium]